MRRTVWRENYVRCLASRRTMQTHGSCRRSQCLCSLAFSSPDWVWRRNIAQCVTVSLFFLCMHYAFSSSWAG